MGLPERLTGVQTNSSNRDSKATAQRPAFGQCPALLPPPCLPCAPRSHEALAAFSLRRSRCCSMRHAVPLYHRKCNGRTGKIEGQNCLQVRTVLHCLHFARGLSQSRRRGQPNVFRRGHAPFDRLELGEFFGAAARAHGARSTPVESPTRFKSEYGRS